MQAKVSSTRAGWPIQTCYPLNTRKPDKNCKEEGKKYPMQEREACSRRIPSSHNFVPHFRRGCIIQRVDKPGLRLLWHTGAEQEIDSRAAYCPPQSFTIATNGEALVLMGWSVWEYI